MNKTIKSVMIFCKWMVVLTVIFYALKLILAAFGIGISEQDLMTDLIMIIAFSLGYFVTHVALYFEIRIAGKLSDKEYEKYLVKNTDITDTTISEYFKNDTQTKLTSIKFNIYQIIKTLDEDDPIRSQLLDAIEIKEKESDDE